MDLLKELKKELAERIKTDMTPFDKWNAQLWAKITFGDYYGKSPEQLVVIHRVVGETVDNVLSKTNFQMTIDSWNGLRNAVDGTDTAETALPDMEDAGLNCEPRQENKKFNFNLFALGSNISSKLKASRKNPTIKKNPTKVQIVKDGKKKVSKEKSPKG